MQHMHGRQYGLDWLRIAAFGLLILYHIGMFFVPWDWHVKARVAVTWIEWPMLALSPWRLSLLFVISGIISRLMLAKTGRAAPFAATRSRRLLLPLLTGIVLVVAPQAWIELRAGGDYGKGFLAFWLHDYFEFGSSRGTPMPTWNHLWFVAYLWFYTIVLAVVASCPATSRARIQTRFDELFSGWGLVAVPIGWLFLARHLLLPAFPETHALFDDPYGHAVYGFAFFLGVGLARMSAGWTFIDRHWPHMLALGAGSFLGLCLLRLPSADSELAATAYTFARSILAWSAILGLLGFARARLNHDGPARRYLTEAIFPFYIVHQTAIVLLGWWADRAGLTNGSIFIILLVGVSAACLATFEGARRTRWLRPFLGLSPDRREHREMRAPSVGPETVT